MEEITYVAVYVPVILATLLGMAAEIEDLAYDVQDRTVQYATDATAALDCAYQARALTDCAPEITNKDFSQEIERTNALLEQARAMS